MGKAGPAPEPVPGPKHEAPNKPDEDLIERVASAEELQPLPGRTPSKLQFQVAKYWKFIIAFVGALVILLNTIVGIAIWGSTAQQWINAAIAALVAVGVFLAKNQKLVEDVTGVDIDADHQEG